ncbi:MAG: glycosyltransferase family 1 protein [Alphaproteobacteria bacterium HGW-Alphaproteobacteria-3]|nr:MAG: glycosyltransferase family 1 protein [Alphaproteobacteria bacterium HGW-Alphaproteobacteria-3]
MIIVHVITRFIRGGADENTLLTCNGQAELGHRVHLVVGSESHPDILARLDPRVELHVMPSLVRAIHPVKDIVALVQCFRLFRRLRPGLVHTHESKAGIVGRWAAWAAGVPGIVHGVHILAFVGSPGLSAFVFRTIEKITAPVTDMFIDVSEGMRSECLSAGIGRPGNHRVIASGMEIERFRSASAPACWREVLGPDVSVSLGGGQEPRFLLMAGALEPRKRVIEFLDVFALVARRVPGAVLLICGDGFQMPRLRRRIAELGLEGRVVPLGFRDDLESLIALSDVCIHAAEREGLPRVVVQFVAGGKPVLVTRLPGIDRVVRDGVNGLYFDPSERDRSALALADLLDDDQRRQSMGSASRDVDVGAWDFRAMVEQMEEVYTELSDAAAPREHRRRIL